jgi:hypothetical protein
LANILGRVFCRTRLQRAAGMAKSDRQSQ